MTKETKLSEFKGIGPKLSEALSLAGLNTVSDLINNYPRRYDDYSNLSPIRDIKPGFVSVKAVIKQARGRYVRRGLHVTEAIASDESGSVRLVWFNQPYRAASLKSNQEYFISGSFELNYQRLSIMNPSIELASSFPINTARIIPIYSETKNFNSAQIRRLVSQILPEIENLKETLPQWLVTENKLMSRAEAIKQLHFPSTLDLLERAKHRLGFEEIFGLSLASLINKQENSRYKSLKIPFKQSLAKTFVDHLPFVLTPDQKRAV